MPDEVAARHVDIDDDIRVWAYGAEAKAHGIAGHRISTISPSTTSRRDDIRIHDIVQHVASRHSDDAVLR
jgi:hypothetical protein